MLMPRLGRLEVLLLLLPLLLDHGAEANVHKWPDQSPAVDDDDDDGGGSKLLNNNKEYKKSNKEKGKMGRYSIPHHLFNDEDTKQPTPRRTTRLPSLAPAAPEAPTTRTETPYVVITTTTTTPAAERSATPRPTIAATTAEPSTSRPTPATAMAVPTLEPTIIGTTTATPTAAIAIPPSASPRPTMTTAETTPTGHPTPSTAGPTAPETTNPSSSSSSVGDSPAPAITGAPATTTIPTTTTNGTASLAPGTVQSNEEPEYKDCTLNITTGVFGSSSIGLQLGAASDGGLDAANTSTSTTTTAGQVVVPYTYQVETTVGVVDDITILDDVLLTLEYAMTERLIPLLLREQCDNVGGGSGVEVRSATTAVAEATTNTAAPPEVVVTGIAVAPPDEIDPDKTCRNVAANDAAGAGLCFVLNGRLTIHYQQHPDHQNMATASSSAAVVVAPSAEEKQQRQLVDHVREQMEREIQSGRFDNAAVAPAITRVGLYVKDDDAAGDSSGGSDDSDNNGSNDNDATLMLDQNTNKPLIGSLVGVFATVTIFATILIRRQWSVRRHRYNMAATGRA